MQEVAHFLGLVGREEALNARHEAVGILEHVKEHHRHGYRHHHDRGYRADHRAGAGGQALEEHLGVLAHLVVELIVNLR